MRNLRSWEEKGLFLKECRKRGTRFPLLPVLLLATCASGQVAKGTGNGTATPQNTVSVTATLDREINYIEKQIVDAAEAMPEEKFSFSPVSLHISGSNYDGVRSFALQLTHIAASNYALWSPITGDKFPKDYLGGNGPENLKTKAEIMRFLKDSFVVGHKAAALLTTDNMLQPPEGGKSPRLYLATFAIAHAFDHYGQMVEYLRMNGIVPPASRGRSD